MSSIFEPCQEWIDGQKNVPEFWKGSLEDIEEASSMISKEASPDANVIWGVAFDDSLDDEMRITIIATGFDKKVGEDNNGGNDAVPTPEPVKPVEVPAEIKDEAPVVAEAVKDEEFIPAEPIVETPAAPVKPEPAPETKDEVPADGGVNYDNLWDVFRRK